MGQLLLSDPELAEGMQNPKVQAAFAEIMKGPGGPMGIMSNPAKLQELMEDDDVGPFMRKLMTKLGPMMGGAGGIHQILVVAQQHHLEQMEMCLIFQIWVVTVMMKCQIWIKFYACYTFLVFS